MGCPKNSDQLFYPPQIIDKRRHWQMNTVNHPILSNGQPLLPARGSATQNAHQHLTTAHSLQASPGMKLSPSNLAKKSSLLSSQGEAVSMTSGIGSAHIEMFQNDTLKGLAIPDMEFAPVAQSFLCSLSDNEQFVRIDDTEGNSDQRILSLPSFVLSVYVSSAVKLDTSQIELIARKMQKLTGFRNLRLKNIVDPSLIAGFTICYGDDESSVIDLSVKGQLAALAARIESSEQRIANSVPDWRSPTA